MADENEKDGIEEEQEEEQQEEPVAPSEDPKPRKTGHKDGALEQELATLEEKRAKLKRTKPEELKPGEYAEVKERIAEIKAELGIQ